MSRWRRERLSAFDLVEAFQLAHAVSALYDLKILASLERPCTAAALAKKHKLDLRFLRGVLEYVAARTDLVRRIDRRFAVAKGYGNGSRFLLDLYAGAYGSNAANLGTLMRSPFRAPSTANRDRYARAFAQTGSETHAWIADIIRQLQCCCILDLGCGPATLLLALAQGQPKLTGWGLDMNPVLCKTARARVRAARLGKRIKIVQGDSKHLREILSPDIRDKIQIVTACQLANEMFGSGFSSISAWLRQMQGTLPGRPLLVADYYSRLGSGRGDLSRETLLHDYAQVISGQGLPPSKLAEWRRIYASAGCRLVHVFEDRMTTRFVHVVML